MPPHIDTPLSLSDGLHKAGCIMQTFTAVPWSEQSQNLLPKRSCRFQHVDVPRPVSTRGQQVVLTCQKGDSKV